MRSTYIDVFLSIIIFSAYYLQTLICSFSSSRRICCSSCRILAHYLMSSVKRRWLLF